jgi:hypothetical protein
MVFVNPPHRQSNFERKVGISPIGALILIIAAVIVVVFVL